MAQPVPAAAAATAAMAVYCGGTVAVEETVPQARILEMAATVEPMRGAGIPEMVEKVELLPGTEMQGMAKTGGTGANSGGGSKEGR